jgi:hypothetical protein
MDSNIHLSSLISRHDDEATRTSTSEGLEEGEVEGETLLIVESEDQASVDLSHDQSGDSLNSDEGDVSWMEEQLSYFCDKCQKWIPASKELLNSFDLSVPSFVFPACKRNTNVDLNKRIIIILFITNVVITYKFI